MAELTNGTTFTDSESGATWTINGTPEYTSDADMRDATFRIEVRGDSSTGAKWDDGDWDDADWVDPADDDLYTWTDITDDYVGAAFTTAFRARFGSQFTPGTAVVTLLNQDGDYTPNKTGATIALGQPLRIICELASREWVRFRGEISRVKLREVAGKPNYATISVRSSMMRIGRANRVGYDVGIAEGELPGARVHRILDSAGHPTSQREIDDGEETLQATTLSGNALDELALVALSEGGELFHDDDGTIVFYDRDTVADLDTATALFTVADYADPGSAGLWFAVASIDTVEELDEVVTHVTIGRDGGTPQTAYDTGAIEAYGYQTINRQDLITEDDTYPATLAAALLADRKDPAERYEAIHITEGDYDALEALGDARILDRIRIRRKYGATELDEHALLRGIKHQIKPATNDSGVRTDTWYVTLITDQII